MSGTAGECTVVLGAYDGTLGDLVHRVQTGEIDIATLPVASVTAQCRAQLSDPGVSTDALASSLTYLQRLLDLKLKSMSHALAGDEDDEAEATLEGILDGELELRERAYLAFREAAEALFSQLSEEGYQSFLGLVTPDIVPVAVTEIRPAELVEAFSAVLARLSALDFVTRPSEVVPVADMMALLDAEFRERRVITFEALFASVPSRGAAIARFLALLELIKEGRIRVLGGGDGIRLASAA